MLKLLWRCSRCLCHGEL